ncbi:L-fucose:H+ symporter permease [Asticcacaulis biprosthecium C19]|uniref:L-fucose:H+ symporter permease n=1 Tax=Asticcacaulis biprosthecium C19 TaxID=715226 RepID=F4QKP6_9CAUL|nr:L-fucose:H+ symporter permease [Asticcacaulis biprosthecium]EGF93348.1 L-fucose:H+ symporter permease [Asticcacaulis biprosthecium C19]
MSTSPASGTPARNALWPVLLITALFFFWGMANNLNDILIPQFKKAFILTDLQSGLVQSAFYMGYFILALPAAFLMRKLGYKAAVIVGLVLYALGAFLFWPAAENHQYTSFLGALFVIASGLAFLETSANPLITVLGSPDKAAFRLNLAQAFNPLGSLAGIWIGQSFILSGIEHDETALAAMTEGARQAFYISEVKAVQTPYLIIGVVVLAWAALVLFSKFPDAATKNAEEDTGEQVGFFASIGRLFSKPRFLMGVVAQFFYVGAQVGIWSYMIRYGQKEIGLVDKDAATYLYYALAAFAAGRFFGTALMSKLSPNLILGVFAVINIGLMIAAVVLGGETGMWALVASSFFMSIMFPTIFATSIAGLGNLTKTGSSLLVMSIIGGAVLTAIMGFVSDQSDIRTSFAVVAACFGVIALYAFTAPKGVKVDSLPASSH